MLATALALWIASAAWDQSAPDAAIELDLTRDLGPVNRLALGHNIEASDPKGIFVKESDPFVTRTGTGVWDPDHRRPAADLFEAARAIGVPIVRYPGGCLVHGFRWKVTVGPLSKRPNFAFGLDEFLSYCHALGALPLITVSDYSCTPEEAGQLVEYLNAPASPDHPWALERAKNGHPEPYGVLWFELGNESDHGNHDLQPKTTWTADQYADWFLACVRAMKAVDPKIRCGALTSTSFPAWNEGWNGTVLRRTAPLADFAIVHCYSVVLTSEAQAMALPYEFVQQAPLASIDAFRDHLQSWRAKVRQAAGKDLPLAVTEFNAMYVQEKPAPLRFSLASALFCAGFVLDLADPRSGVPVANYWQFANGYWGMVRNQGFPSMRRLPAYRVYELLHRGLRGTLIASGRAGPSVSFLPPQQIGITERCEGDRAEPEAVEPRNLFRPAEFQPHSEPKAVSSADSGVFRLRLRGATTDLYPLLAPVDGPDGALLDVSFEGRFVGSADGARLGLSVLDRRGWEPYHSGVAIEGVEQAPQWRKFSGRLPTLTGSKGCLLAWRVIAGARPVEGLLEIRGLAVRVVKPGHRAAYPALQYVACREPGREEASVLVLNRDASRPHLVRWNVLGGSVRSAEALCVAGDRLDDTNLERETVTIRPLPVRLQQGGRRVEVNVPPASLVQIQLRWSNP